MNKLMLVILIITTFQVTISVSSLIVSDNEATDQGEWLIIMHEYS